MRVGKGDRAPELMRAACVAPERQAGLPAGIKTRARLRVGKGDRPPELMRGACVALERQAGHRPAGIKPDALARRQGRLPTRAYARSLRGA